MNQLLSVEVADFVEAVDLALADLPPEVRAELLEDLPAHLADVVADGGTPVGELGEPAVYAAELRAAAGHPPSTVTAARPRDYLAKLRSMDTRAGSVLGYARLTELLRALQPAWWVLRGYLAVQLLTGAWGRTGLEAVTPIVYDSEPLGFVVLIALVAASVWVGRRTLRSGRAAVVAVSTVVTIVLVVTGANVTRRAVAPVTFTDVTTPVGPLGDTSNVTNIYPYGPDGKVEKDIRLIDQDGNPLYLQPPCDSGDEVEPQTFPIVCKGGTAGFDPEAPIKPLPSASATATGTAPPATSAAAPLTTTLTPTRPATPTATPSR